MSVNEKWTRKKYVTYCHRKERVYWQIHNSNLKVEGIKGCRRKGNVHYVEWGGTTFTYYKIVQRRGVGETSNWMPVTRQP
jgi:hypothetical protein